MSAVISPLASSRTRRSPARVATVTPPAGTWGVRVPGGELVVTLAATTSLLTGPAVIVAEGELDEAWLRGQAGERIRPAGPATYSGRTGSPRAGSPPS